MAPSKDKIEIINHYLQDDYILIHFDARKEGTDLPDHLLGNPTVTLKLSFKFQGGMEVTEERVWASLLFGGKYKDCFIPTSAIWGATSSSGANTIWPDDAPPEVVMQVFQSLASQQKGDSKKGENILSAITRDTELNPTPNKNPAPNKSGKLASVTPITTTLNNSPGSEIIPNPAKKTVMKKSPKKKGPPPAHLKRIK